MKKALLTLFLFAVGISSAHAENLLKPTFGVEWGYSPALYMNYKYVYKDDYGTTVSDTNSGFSYDGNFYFAVSAGFKNGKKSELSLLGGITGIGENRKGIPLLVRYNYAASGRTQDGALVFADGGVVFPINTSANRPAYMGRIGGGYRVIFSNIMFLDFNAGIRAIFDHPCEKTSIRRNDSFNIGPCFSVSVGF